MMSLAGSVVLATAVALAGPLPSAAPSGAERSQSTPDLGRQVLAAGDGWASADGGTTGGSSAAPANVHEVSTRDELAAAVAGNEPKIVYVKQGFNANTAPDGTAITCGDYATGGYSLEAYLAAFDPANWTGPASRAPSKTPARIQVRSSASGSGSMSAPTPPSWASVTSSSRASR